MGVLNVCVERLVYIMVDVAKTVDVTIWTGAS
jgi:hypothetical protein